MVKKINKECRMCGSDFTLYIGKNHYTEEEAKKENVCEDDGCWVDETMVLFGDIPIPKHWYWINNDEKTSHYKTCLRVIEKDKKLQNTPDSELNSQYHIEKKKRGVPQHILDFVKNFEK